ncbi:hypothetical protein LTR50_000803 [Elasticomyces elasticus]|nr:hypothetical protein LTR50_000803 [Elasticomyces elasticus]
MLVFPWTYTVVLRSFCSEPSATPIADITFASYLLKLVCVTPPALFPTYLLPSLPFRRKSSTDSNASTSSTGSSATSRDSSNPAYLTTSSSQLRCMRCSADLAYTTQIISKGFTGRHGRSYLVSPSTASVSSTYNPSATYPPPSSLKAKNDALPNLPNTFTHKPVPRTLVTGAHVVSDVSCAHCGAVLGWKYVDAEEEAQKYKIGKFILETKRVCSSTWWEGNEEDDGAAWATGGATSRSQGPGAARTMMAAEETVEFDSQDEDECEDLFAGVWTPELAVRRRRAKRFGNLHDMI